MNPTLATQLEQLLRSGRIDPDELARLEQLDPSQLSRLALRGGRGQVTPAQPDEQEQQGGSATETSLHTT